MWQKRWKITTFKRSCVKKKKITAHILTCSQALPIVQKGDLWINYSFPALTARKGWGFKDRATNKVKISWIMVPRRTQVIYYFLSYCYRQSNLSIFDHNFISSTGNKALTVSLERLTVTFKNLLNTFIYINISEIRAIIWI